MILKNDSHGITETTPINFNSPTVWSLYFRIGYAESSDNDATSDEELDLCEVISAWNIKKPDEAMPTVPISSPSKKPSSCEKKSVTSNSSALGVSYPAASI